VAPYRILSIDGGGIRGLLTAVLLDRLVAAVPGWLDRVDLFAGTSTGGILVLGLAKGLPPSAIVKLYREDGQRVFSASWFRRLLDLGGWLGARYDNAGLRGALEELLGPATLGDLPRRVLVPTFELDNHGAKGLPRTWKPKFFHNFPGPDSDAAERVVDVAVRTSAAPTYFPTYQGYIDGGVMANNPSMAALAQALDAGTGKQSLDAVQLLSVGTGLNSTFLPGDRLDWGKLRWARPIVDAMIEGTMGVADYQCARLLGPRYHRLEPVLSEVIPLDAADKVDRLVALAQEVDLGATIDWLQKSF
jgi:patatin-like phospholipase/acyl hydrolase